MDTKGNKTKKHVLLSVLEEVLIVIILFLFLKFHSKRQIFHYMSSVDGLIVLCMADAQTGNRVAFSFLQDVQNRFRGR